jgi:hypothetical protein
MELTTAKQVTAQERVVATEKSTAEVEHFYFGGVDVALV